jgi:hypothetical protein
MVGKRARFFAPGWVHWHGNAPLKLDLSEIQGKDNIPRRVDELAKKEGIKP